MSAIFLSHKFSNVDRDELIHSSTIIKQALYNQGFMVFFSLDQQEFFEHNQRPYQTILDYCLEQQKKSDTILFFINHEEASSGMSAELVHALELKQHTILCIRKGLNYSEFRQIAHHIIEFDTVEDLRTLLKISY